MDLAQYGISTSMTFFLLAIGVVIGKLWQKTLSQSLYGRAAQTKLHRSLIILLLFVASLVGTYCLVGVVLTCFVYAALTSGILGEWTAELTLLLIHVIAKSFTKPLQPINGNTNWHILPEAQKE